MDLPDRLRHYIDGALVDSSPAGRSTCSTR